MTLHPLVQWQNAVLKIPSQRPNDLGTLSLNRQQRVGLAGASGVGKTTLLRMLAGLTQPAPCVTFDSKLIANHQWPMLRSRLIYLHQQPQFPASTIEENLQRSFEFKTNGKRTLNFSTVKKLMGRLNLDHLSLEQSVDNLSQGERQRLSLIRSLQLHPSILLLDEPTSALDADSAQAVEQLLLQWASKPNKAFILISHDAQQLARMTNSTWRLELKEGRRYLHAN